MGEGGVEGENCFQEVPPHPLPLPRWGEGNKSRSLRGAERRGNLILSVYHHPSFPNVHLSVIPECPPFRHSRMPTFPSFPNVHLSVIPECLYRESMPFQLPLDPDRTHSLNDPIPNFKNYFLFADNNYIE